MDPDLREIEEQQVRGLLRWRRIARERGYSSGWSRDALADFLAVELGLIGQRVTLQEAREIADRMTEILIEPRPPL